MRRLRDAESPVRCSQTTVTSGYNKLISVNVNVNVNARGWRCKNQSGDASPSDSEISDPTVYRHCICSRRSGTKPRSSYGVAIELEIEARPRHRSRSRSGCGNTSPTRHSWYLLPLGPQTSQGEAANIVPPYWLWELDCGAQAAARVWNRCPMGYGREETKWAIPRFASILP